MYIEFSLPSGAHGMAAAYTLQQIRQHLNDWSAKYNVEFLSIKTVKYTVRVTFADQKYYDFFALTWNPVLTNLSKNSYRNSVMTSMSSYIKNFRLVEPMTLPKSIDSTK